MCEIFSESDGQTDYETSNGSIVSTSIDENGFTTVSATSSD